jgi:hypothetical protein
MAREKLLDQVLKYSRAFVSLSVTDTGMLYDYIIDNNLGLILGVQVSLHKHFRLWRIFSPAAWYEFGEDQLSHVLVGVA